MENRGLVRRLSSFKLGECKRGEPLMEMIKLMKLIG